MTAAERVRRVDGAVLDLRLALSNPKVHGERRRLLQVELDLLRLARVGVRCRGQRSYLQQRLGIAPPGAVRRARAGTVRRV
jgi:hypothetical protein